LTITNSTISENTVAAAQLSPEGTSGFGGGMFWSGSGHATVRNSTFTGNSAPAGGGIGIVGGTLSLGSTIVAGNSAAAQADGNEINSLLPASVVSAGFNLIGDTPGDSANTGAPISYSPSDIVDTNPQLGTLASYGGPTPTHNLPPNSPGHDKGCAFGATTDQRGLPRTVDAPSVANASCTNPSENGTDIGSVEILAPTAAGTTISGQVKTADGRGIPNVIVTVRDRNGGIVGTTRTDSFGIYSIDGLTVAQLYIVSVQSKWFVFPVESVAVWLHDSLEGLDFVASP
jgi:hypothetical protein